MFNTKVVDINGKQIKLTNAEVASAERAQLKIKNELGYKVDITTLTSIIKTVSEQKFFEIAPADFIPVRVGEGSFSDEVLAYRSFSIADDFESGIVNTGSNNSKLAVADSGVDTVKNKINDWAKTIGWSVLDLQKAQKSGNWDLVASKEESRKRNWDQGIQKVAFLGINGNPDVNGLLTLSGITSNLTLVTKPISDMTGAELTAFVAGVLDAYRTNCERTAWPTHFAIPESDYLGLASPSDENFHIKSKLDVLLETFRTMTKNANFQILPLAYADKAYSGLLVQRYALYNSDEKSLRMDIPVDYTSTLANTVNGFNFENVAYGEFTGVMAIRPKEMLYFDY